MQCWYLASLYIAGKKKALLEFVKDGLIRLSETIKTYMVEGKLAFGHLIARIKLRKQSSGHKL